MEVGYPQLPTAKPSRGTLAPGEGPPGFAYGAITLYGGAFQPTSATPGRPPGPEARPRSRNPTSPPTHRRRVWFGLPPFRSPLLRGSLLVSLPPPTKMFPFGGFPTGTPPKGFPAAEGCSPPAGSPIRGSRVRRLPAPPPGLSQLAAPFLGARAEPSTGRLDADEPAAGPGACCVGACARRSLSPLRGLAPSTRDQQIPGFTEGPPRVLTQTRLPARALGR